jgi:hypothetical protein
MPDPWKPQNGFHRSLEISLENARFPHFHRRSASDPTHEERRRAGQRRRIRARSARGQTRELRGERFCNTGVHTFCKPTQSHRLQMRGSELAGETESSQVISLIFAGGVAIGFLISAIAIAILRLLFLAPYLRGKTPGGYEAGVPKTSFQFLWNSVTGDSKPVERDMLYAVGVYDHCRVPSSLHSWVGRRWNTFMVSVNCCVATGWAHFVASHSTWFGIAATQTWRRTDATLVIVLLINGFCCKTTGPRNAWLRCNAPREDGRTPWIRKSRQIKTCSRRR